MHERILFTVRPLCFADCAVIDDPVLWKRPRINIWPLNYGIGAFTPMGELGAYAGFLPDTRGADATITAIQSRISGAGIALLDALKIRTYRLVAEDVMASSVSWWEKRGFVLWNPANEDDEEGIVGSYEWWRDDDPFFADLPYEPMWLHHRNQAKLIWDEQDRQKVIAAAAKLTPRL